MKVPEVGLFRGRKLEIFQKFATWRIERDHRWSENSEPTGARGDNPTTRTGYRPLLSGQHYTDFGIQENRVKSQRRRLARLIAASKSSYLLARYEGGNQGFIINKAKGIRLEMDTPLFLFGRESGKADRAQVDRPDWRPCPTWSLALGFKAKAEG